MIRIFLSSKVYMRKNGCNILDHHPFNRCSYKNLRYSSESMKNNRYAFIDAFLPLKMILAEQLARLESKLQPLIARMLSPAQQVALYSSGRPVFLKEFFKGTPERYEIPAALSRTCWGIRFRSPIFNAAGMFKNAEGFNLVDAQGAGAYLG